MKKHEILAAAKRHLGMGNNETEYVCHAIDRVCNTFSVNAEAVYYQCKLLKDWIRDDQLKDCYVLNEFIKQNDRPLYDKLHEEEGWLQYRLDWVDRMIEYWKLREEPLSNSKMLELAKDFLGSNWGQSWHVCLSVDRVALKYDCWEAAQALEAWIHKYEIPGHHTLEGYVSKTDPELWQKLNDEQGWIQFRKDWIDRMVLIWIEKEKNNEKE